MTEVDNKNNQQFVTNSTLSDTVSPDVLKWVGEVKKEIQVIAGCHKAMEHWQKRELDSAIVCGEYLAKIRKSYGERGQGFKSFIESEFANEFSYKTCLRYMKLFNRKKNLSSTVGNLRQAYIELGILKESYHYPENSVENTEQPSTTENHTANRVESSSTETNVSSVNINEAKSQIGPRVVTLNDTNAIVFACESTNGSGVTKTEVLEFKFDGDGDLLGRSLLIPMEHIKATPNGVNLFLKKMKPFVDWYLVQSQRTNVISNSLNPKDEGKAFAE
jgi:hypothetical protein